MGIAAISFCASQPSQLLDDYEHLRVSYASLECGLKICDPDSSDEAAVPRGVAGEICVAGAIPKPTWHVGVADTPKVTHVNSRGYPWKFTGDQGLMSDDGQVRILGRYKDIIKKGGEGVLTLCFRDSTGRKRSTCQPSRC